ncbi:MAG: OmpA family protein [Arenimonas sp.]|jgi:outer membrane protein OmpA-like peptidoglycan-associated protein|nr:OmpA family protein [Arenimonas sp.]
MKHAHSLIAVSLFAFIVGGCATSPDDPNANAKQKAMIGAAVGTAIGLATGDTAVERRQQAMVGAALGAAAGGGIGHYQDRQEAKLRQQLQGTGVDVSRDGNNITLDMPSGITFAFNSSDVNSQFYPVLDKVAATLSEYNQTTVNVAGHTDSVGSDSYNQRLSEQRASSVASYLQSRGVANQRLQISGYGESRPVDSNETESGRANNRRVEITLVPIAQ